MGVPSFFRWLMDKYPNMVFNALEDTKDKSLPNPNGLEFDNLYLDMNGIIHPCFHPDDSMSPPTTFEAVFNNIFEYIDRLFNIVRPRKLLFMAIDGVAPRAKMNQQRARRFRTSKDNEIAEQEEERLRREFQMEGKKVLPKQESEVSDSNIITPGTEFMYRLSKKLESYIRQRIENDRGWKEIKVILSDSNAPGEGEHKIMSFIRVQRTFPDYNPNTRHCLYGLDADLIMLALATHEVQFSILREVVLMQDTKPISESLLEFSLNEAEGSSAKSRGWFKQHVLMRGEKFTSESSPQISQHETKFDPAKSEGCPDQGLAVNRSAPSPKKPYQFLHIWILREYMELDMRITELPENFKVDFERIIDDFVLLCFFAGNDFLPHMPTLEIHEGALDLIIHVYKKEFKNLGGYFVDMNQVEDKMASYVKLKRVEKFILLVGTYEEKIFKKRSELRERKLRRILSDQDNDEGGAKFEINSTNVHRAFHNGEDPSIIESEKSVEENYTSSNGIDALTADNSEIERNTKELKEKLKDCVRSISDVFKNGGLGTDKVRLGTIGWKERYYKEKFSAESQEDIESMRKRLVERYTEGLCWVLLYYFSGVPSWTWYYPYHYGPFASDLKGLSQIRVKFQKGLPFKPFDQLMGVLPPRSAHALPIVYQALMTDENSSIIDFYPTDFEIDMDGKRYMWQGICKLPFIVEERLLNETKKLEKELKKVEAQRNEERDDQLFVGSASMLASQVLSLYKKQMSAKTKDAIKIDTSLSGGINGFMRIKFKEDSNVLDADGPKDDIPDNNVLCVFYEPSQFCVHIPRSLEGVEHPEKTITEADIVERQLWHESQGNRPRYANHSIETSRLQIQARYMKADNGERSRFKSSSSEIIWKDAGKGWGATGRGKVCTTIPEPSSSGFRKHNKYPTFTPHGHYNRASLPSNSYARGHIGPSLSRHHPPVSSCEGNFKFNEKWNMVGYGRGESMKDLRISESSQGFKSYGRAASVNNQFWQTRNSSTSNMNHNWRQNMQSAASVLPVQGQWNRRQNSNTNQVWQCKLSSAAPDSTQVSGRGHYVPNTCAAPDSTQVSGKTTPPPDKGVDV